MSEYIYTWEFDDSRNRGALWYVIALSIVVGLSIWGFLTKQYGMSFIVLLIAGLAYFVENNSEDKIQVKIDNIGVKIAGTFYDFKSIESFGVVYKGSEAILIRFFLNKKGLRNIDVQINNEILEDVRNALINNLNETQKIDLSFSEKMIQLLKL
ncbi:MAG: hypothetical protein PHS49_07445 [Candidatus Gracilibacteria bacterium]|nr:hypothetical protein [Candidatus Gracilibacteria bacterium]